jgi:hypothetical protein
MKKLIFRKKNYPQFGYDYCASELNINISKVKSKVQRLEELEL